MAVDLECRMCQCRLDESARIACLFVCLFVQLAEGEFGPLPSMGKICQCASVGAEEYHTTNKSPSNRADGKSSRLLMVGG
ncbi:hypothetical protein GE21DRAFT_1282921 [Neurospora crassa]|nr:hypothetical protein GE21DRAFT_1282921 [Neurospora crassa]